MIFKSFLALCIGLAGLYAAQDYWLQAMTAKVAQSSGSQLLPAAAPAFEIDPGKRLDLSKPVPIDTSAAQRGAAEGTVRQIELQHQAIQSYTPRR